MPRPSRHVAGRFASVDALKAWIEASRRNSRQWEDAAWQRRNGLSAVDLARLDLLKDESACGRRCATRR